MYAFDVLEFWVAFVHSMVKQFTKSKKSNNTKTIFSKTIPYYKRKHQKGVQKKLYNALLYNKNCKYSAKNC